MNETTRLRIQSLPTIPTILIILSLMVHRQAVAIGPADGPNPTAPSIGLKKVTVGNSKTKIKNQRPSDRTATGVTVVGHDPHPLTAKEKKTIKSAEQKFTSMRNAAPPSEEMQKKMQSSM